MAKSKSWPTIGRLLKGEKGSYIQLGEKVEIFIDGVKLNLNEKKYVNLEDPRKKVEQLAERGIIDEAEAEKRRASLSERSWYKYDLIAPPKRD